MVFNSALLSYCYSTPESRAHTSHPSDPRGLIEPSQSSPNCITHAQGIPEETRGNLFQVARRSAGRRSASRPPPSVVQALAPPRGNYQVDSPLALRTTLRAATRATHIHRSTHYTQPSQRQNMLDSSPTRPQSILPMTTHKQSKT